VPVLSPAEIRRSDSRIRQIDFREFTPPPQSCSQRISVENGRVHLIQEKPVQQGSVGAAFVNYGDVDGDGQEDALVAVAIETAGSAIPYCAYVYTLHSGTPKLLWSIQTGDRAEGGLRRMYAEDKELIVELYSTDGSNGACCPSRYDRIRFRWNGREFEPVGPSELLEQSPQSGAAPLMSQYTPN
jgi:hypothetical protein